MPSKLGKRYKCEVCGTEALSTKAGEGTLPCCEKEMQLQEPKTIPSSDWWEEMEIPWVRDSHPNKQRIVFFRGSHEELLRNLLPTKNSIQIVLSFCKRWMLHRKVSSKRYPPEGIVQNVLGLSTSVVTLCSVSCKQGWLSNQISYEHKGRPKNMEVKDGPKDKKDSLYYWSYATFLVYILLCFKSSTDA